MPITTDIFPPFINDLGEYRVAMVSQSVQCLNVIYALGDPTASFGVNSAQISGALFDFYEELAANALGDFWSVTDIVAFDRSVANGAEITYTPSAPIVGDAALEALPLQTQLCITWRTANSGRRYRGRTYIPGFTIDNNTTAGEPAGATITVVQTAVDNLLSNLNTLDCSLAVLSRGKVTTLPDVAPPSAPDWEGFATPVTNGLVRGGWDVLRSRRS